MVGRWFVWSLVLLCLAGFCFCLYANFTLPYKLAQRETVAAKKMEPERTPPAEAYCRCARCCSSLP